MSITAYKIEAVGHDRTRKNFGYVNIMYRYGNKQSLTWYNGYMDMSEAEVRDGEDEKERAVRMRWNHQYICLLYTSRCV